MSKAKLTEENISEIEELIQQGYSKEEIAKKFGISRQNLYAFCKKHNIQTKKKLVWFDPTPEEYSIIMREIKRIVKSSKGLNKWELESYLMEKIFVEIPNSFKESGNLRSFVYNRCIARRKDFARRELRIEETSEDAFYLAELHGNMDDFSR